jgi:N-acyl-phosphatidylethanolamine-hydrolysing phospholipase D
MTVNEKVRSCCLCFVNSIADDHPSWKLKTRKLSGAVLFVLGCLGVNSCTVVRIAIRNVPPSFRRPRLVLKLDRSDVPAGARLVATWIGHSTVLVQMDDAYFLTDSILTQRIGMVSTRLVEPGMDLDAIPSLNAVLISHRHFDHLSPASLRKLGSRVHAVVTPPT